MKRLDRWGGRITLWLGGLVLVLMVSQIVIDVILRSVMGTGLPATSELVSKYYMVAVSFVPVAYAELKCRHVEATVFTDYLPQRARTVVVLLGFLISLVVYLVLGWGTALEAIEQTRKGAYVEAGTYLFYTWPSYWLLPLSFVLMALVLALRVIQTAMELLTNRIVDHSPNVISVTLGQAEECK